MTPAARGRGFTLIEVLVAVLVLSVGLLGLAGLHSIGMKNNHGAYLRTQAVVLTYDILERMRGNRELALDGSYDIKLDAAGGKDPTTIAERDLSEWKTGLAQRLPDGDGSIACAGTGECTVTVQWDDSRGLKAKKDTGERSFAVTTRL